MCGYMESYLPDFSIKYHRPACRHSASYSNTNLFIFDCGLHIKARAGVIVLDSDRGERDSFSCFFFSFCRVLCGIFDSIHIYVS